MIKMWDQNYQFNYAITATQKKILKAFDLTAANVREQAGILAMELKNIDNADKIKGTTGKEE